MIILNEVQVDEIRNKYHTIERNKYFHLSLTFVTMSIFIIFAIRPAIIDAVQTYRNYKDLKLLIEILEKKKESLSKAAQLMVEYSEEIKLLDQVLPKNSQESNFLANLNQSATKYKVIISQIRFDKVSKSEKNGTTQDKYDKQKFNANFDARYENFKEFIADVNNFRRLVEIESIEITQDEDLNGLRVNGRIVGYIYFKK